VAARQPVLHEAVRLPGSPGATHRAPTRKRTVLPLLHTIQTLRFTVFHRAAELLRPQGAMRLRLANNAATRQTYTRIRDALADLPRTA
jgi:hypothetical protein